MSLCDKSLTCFDCGETFKFSVEEQEEFLSKGHFNAPKRCPACREARKERQLKNGSYKSIQPGFRSQAKMYSVTCAACGNATQVPFQPKAGRPVFCRDCYHAARVAK